MLKNKIDNGNSLISNTISYDNNIVKKDVYKLY